MKIYSEMSLSNFEFWSGAKVNAEKLTLKEMDQIENILEDLYSEGMSETEINDLFWFDFESILEWIGKKECDQCGEIYEGHFCECEEEEEI